MDLVQCWNECKTRSSEFCEWRKFKRRRVEWEEAFCRECQCIGDDDDDYVGEVMMMMMMIMLEKYGW